MHGSRLLQALQASEKETLVTPEDVLKSLSATTSPEEKAAIHAWLERALSTTLAPNATVDEVAFSVGEMNRTLQSQSFLASPAKETAADIVVYGCLNQHITKLGGGDAILAQFPNVARWLNQMQESVFRKLGLSTIVRFEKVGSVRSIIASSSVGGGGGGGDALSNSIAPPINSGEKKKEEKPKKKDNNNEEKKPALEASSVTAAAAAATTTTTTTASATEAGDGGKKKDDKKKEEKKEDAQFLPSCLDVRVGKILTAKKHPEADTLYVEEIDLGESTGPRTICSGLVKYYSSAEELVGKMVLVVCNLKPRTMKGVDSNGMVLAASDAGKANVELIVPPPNSVVGEAIAYQNATQVGAPLAASAVNKKKILEDTMPGWFCDEEGRVGWKDLKENKTYLMEVKDKGVVTSGKIRSGTVG